MRLGDDLPIRVKEKEVYEKLELGYEYCSKNIWKETVRNPNMKKSEPPKEESSKRKGNLKGKAKKLE